MRNPIRVLATAVLLLVPATHAQYSVGAVAYQGGAPYTDAELTAIAGLQAGQMTQSDSIGNAAQHLLDTGLFDDVQATYTLHGKALNITFQIKPTPLTKLLPVSLENFVWFTPQEIATALHGQLPLYRGVSSDAGSFSDSIQAALQQMLTAKGISVKLSHGIVEPTNQHPLRVVDYRVASPVVRLTKIDLNGPIPEAIQPELAKALTAATGKPLNIGLTELTLQDRLLAPARNAGYIAATLKEVQPTFAPTAKEVAVTVSATLDVGSSYKLSTLTLDPGPLYTATDLARDTQLHPGDLASARQLALTELPLQTAYLKQGYLDAYVTATPIPNEQDHTVSYTLKAIPGEIYHLKSVTATGLSPEAQKAFDADWTLKEGDIYDATYIATFLKKNIALEPFNSYSIAYRAIGDPQTHQVDLTLTFVRSR
jgi:outer membrane protein assembly factor BamA